MCNLIIQTSWNGVKREDADSIVENKWLSCSWREEVKKISTHITITFIPLNIDSLSELVKELSFFFSSINFSYNRHALGNFFSFV